MSPQLAQESTGSEPGGRLFEGEAVLPTGAGVAVGAAVQEPGHGASDPLGSVVVCT
jgi:hypothetical protein